MVLIEVPWELLGKYGGIGGLIIGMVFLLFQSIINRPNLKERISRQWFTIIKTIIWMAFIYGILSFFLFFYMKMFSPRLYTLQYKAVLKDQFGNPCRDLHVFILGVERKDTICGPIISDNDGFVYCEKKDASMQSINATLLVEGNDSIKSFPKIIQFMSSDALHNNTDTIRLFNKKPPPKTFFTEDETLKNIISDSLHIQFSGTSPTYSIRISYSTPHLTTLDGGYFSATGGNQIVCSVNGNCSFTLAVAQFPRTKDYNGDQAGFLNAIKSAQMKTFHDNIQVVFSRIRSCFQR